MSETGAYLCDRDLLNLAEGLFATGAVLIPDARSEKPEPQRIDSLTLLASRLGKEDTPTLWFIVSPDWERSPLEMDSVVKDGRQYYYIVQKSGGPSIDIYYPHSFESAAGSRLRPGFIAYHSQFWNPKTQQMELAPAKLVERYKALRNELARGGRRVKQAGRSFIVTRNVDKLGVIIST